MIKRLLKIKANILNNVCFRRFIHYCKDLQDLNMSINGFLIPEDMRIDYYSNPSEALLVSLGVNPKYKRKDDQGIFISHKNEPAGCILLNLNGVGESTVPFIHKFYYGNNHVYAHELFVKQSFRSKGIAKLLCLESWKLLKDRFRYFNVLADAKSFTTDRAVQSMGFKKIKEVVFIKVFFFKITLVLDSVLKVALYDISYSLFKFVLNIIKLPAIALIALIKKALCVDKDLFLTTYLIISRDKHKETKLAFIVREMYKKFIFDKIFPGGYDIKIHKRFYRNRLRREFINISADVDMVIVDERFEYLHRKLSKLSNVKFMPQWVNQRVILSNGLPDFSRKNNHSAYYDVQLIRRYNYSYVFTKSPRLLDFFYENMYLPFITNRFNDNERINTPKEKIQKYFRNGGLLLVKDGKKYISGAVIEISNNTLHGVYQAVLNGDSAYVQNRALAALYYFQFKFAHDNGYKAIDFGLSRAFLNDGVLRHKSKWKTDIWCDKQTNNVYAFRFCRLSDPIKSFLINNPFISIEGDKLIGNILFPSLGNIDKGNIYRKYKLSGISDIRIVDLDKEQYINVCQS